VSSSLESASMLAWSRRNRILSSAIRIRLSRRIDLTDS
jgi:hypothetical protein